VGGMKGKSKGWSYSEPTSATTVRTFSCANNDYFQRVGVTVLTEFSVVIGQ
jgi:hypothetical protein